MAKNKVELLAPCGTYESFEAAIKAGADAVYLGLNKFGARANAGNFSIEELIKALEIAHILDKKIYLTVNTLFRDNEINELFDFLNLAYINGLDGVIVQDIGVMSFISKNFPDLPVHASTQAAITAAEGYEAIKDFNVTRIVPARELSLEEIKNIKRKTGIEIECFIHGALCYSYSGKCLFSSFLGGRSGNRGRCAQPCRLMYNDKYLLSMKDLCSIEMIPEMIESGISSFKIEGRMKSPEYVYGVTSLYRKYIDLYYKGGKYYVDKSDKEHLLSLYTRSGNCDGYYHKHNGRDMITITSPSYNSENSSKNALSNILFPKRPVNIKVTIRSLKGIVVHVFDDEFSVITTTDVIPSVASNHPATIDSVTKQINKLGNTPFSVNSIEVDLEDGLFLTSASLNLVRRLGIEAFTDKIKEKYRRQSPLLHDFTKESNESKINHNITNSNNDDYRYEINVSVLNIIQALCALKYSKVSGIIVPCFVIDSLDDINLQKLCQSILESNKLLYLQLPIVFREDNRTNSAELIDNVISVIEKLGIKISGVYCSNLEEVTYINHKYDLKLIGDIHLYSYNNEAVKSLSDYNINRLTMPVELNYKELNFRESTNDELIIYGKLPMMISSNCVCNTQNGCCNNKLGHFEYINDRKGARLPVFCNCSECSNYVFNSIPLYLGDKKEEIHKLNPQSLRILFTDEDEKKCRHILDLLTESGNTEITYDFADFEFTRGHFNKGID